MADLLQLHYFIAFAGCWALGNGILHDVFVLIERRPYERELIRLLIDGHILIFTGIIFLLCVSGIADHQPLAYFISITASLFLLGYCALIFKLLPSILTIVINLIALLWLLIDYVNRAVS